MARLRDGCHIYQGPDGQWRLALPDGSLQRLRLSAEDGRALAELVTSGQDADRVLAGNPATTALGEALDALDAAGLLAPTLSAPPTRVADAGRRARAAVAVDGDTLVADLLTDVLTRAGQAIVPDADGPGAAMVVACAGWLPDRRWQRQTRRCTARGVAWHCCYWEGHRLFLGPPAAPGRPGGYGDTRARRLAASTRPDELEAYWRHLEEAPGLPPPPVAPALAAVAAGLLAADVLAILAGHPAPHDRWQLELDPTTFELRRHPVLPLPHEILTAGEQPPAAPLRAS
ncbi:hypothetical protein [Frankia sp. CiP3]|uniref:hypothetical protein n=1 Tax=Frankia sp. CiP3 TaxID=2880971 RepID=UPI001EF4D8E5|nr:hypothetical protein [Frankia sp. CiP3]